MPSLVDDPSFLADLDVLDNGLIGTATVSRVVPSVAAAPIVLQPGSHRPLLDLFPLTPRVARIPPPSERATIAAPHPGRTLRVAAPAVDREPDRRAHAAADLDVDSSDGRDWLRFVGAGVLFALLATVGASAAALVFHDRVQTIVARWHSSQP